jgi:4'-phosphopantetheinyl transferase
MISNHKIFYPVIMKVPDSEQLPRGKEQVRLLSRLARQAARTSIGKSGLSLPEFRKNDDGVPMPIDGIYWSVSHKTRYVAGVVTTEPVGIDVEHVRPIKSGLMEYIANEEEWRQIGGKATRAFFRIWTAKEAVLKATGVGFTGLSNCRIVRVIDDHSLIVRYSEKQFVIHQTWFNKNHIAAITGNERSIHWDLI